MTLVDFAITYCCENLHLAMIKREYAFEIDTGTGKCILINTFDEDKPVPVGDRCPFCHRNMEDVIDVDIIEK